MSCLVVFRLFCYLFPQIFSSLLSNYSLSGQTPIHGPLTKSKMPPQTPDGQRQVVIGLDDDFLSSPEALAINKNQTFVSWQMFFSEKGC